MSHRQQFLGCDKTQKISKYGFGSCLGIRGPTNRMPSEMSAHTHTGLVRPSLSNASYILIIQKCFLIQFTFSSYHFCFLPNQFLSVFKLSIASEAVCSLLSAQRADFPARHSYMLASCLRRCLRLIHVRQFHLAFPLNQNKQKKREKKGEK